MKNVMDRPLLKTGRCPPSYSTNYSVKTDVSKNAILDLTLTESKQLASLTVDPLTQNRNIQHPTTNFETMMHLLKANIGTGVLALPQSFIHSGLAFGTVGLVAIAIVCVHCMQMLLQCSQTLCVRSGLPPLDYASTAEQAFNTGPRHLRRFAKWSRFFANLFICITQIGFCVVYWVFVASNIQKIANDYVASATLDYRVYMAIILLPLMVMMFIKNLKYLVPLSVIATVCEVVAFVMLFYYLFKDVPPASIRKQLPSLGGLPLWFGTSIYAFEGIALVLPLENSMKTPRDMPGWTGVLNTSMSLVTILYTAVAFFGYLRFGPHLKGSITLSLPHQLPALIIQLAYAIGIFLSLALQFYVPVEIMWPTIVQRFGERRRIAEYGFRILLIAFIFALGALIPQFELFISLVGALGGSCLSLIFPAVLHVITYWPEGISWPTIAKDVAIVLFGIIGFVTGTYASMMSIIVAFNSENQG